MAACLAELHSYAVSAAGAHTFNSCPGSSPAMLRLDQLLHEAHMLIAGLAVLNPGILRTWHVLPTMEQKGRPSGPGWAEAVVVRRILSS